MIRIQEQLQLPEGVIQSDKEEAALSLLRTTEMLLQHARKTLFSDGLSQSQFNILMILQHEVEGGISQKAIGKRLITTKGNTSQHIAHLLEMGLIKRRESTQDRRRRIITLTAKGRRAVAKVEPQYREQIATVFHAMTKSELGALIHSVDKLRHNLIRARTTWEAEE